jgi:hypothetical protein
MLVVSNSIAQSSHHNPNMQGPKSGQVNPKRTRHVQNIWPNEIARFLAICAARVELSVRTRYQLQVSILTVRALENLSVCLLEGLGSPHRFLGGFPSARSSRKTASACRKKMINSPSPRNCRAATTGSRYSRYLKLRSRSQKPTISKILKFESWIFFCVLLTQSKAFLRQS